MIDLENEIENSLTPNPLIEFIENEAEYIKNIVIGADTESQLKYFTFYADMIHINIKLIETTRKLQELDYKIYRKNVGEE